MTKTTTNFQSKTKNISYMKIMAGIVSFIIIAGFVGSISPLYVFAQIENQTSSTNTETYTSVNATNSENETAVGEKISNFVHNAIQLFKEQRDETIQTIKECRASLGNSTGTSRTQLMDTCKTNLQTIHDKYSDVKNKYRELFKQYKEQMHVFVKEAKGHLVNPIEKKKALDNIMNIRKHSEGTQDVLQGIKDILKGHKMTNLGHPLRGHMAIEKGKQQIRQGMHDLKKVN